MADKPPDEMVWDGRLETLVVPARGSILRFTLYGVLVLLYSAGVGYTERSAGRRICVYLLGWVATW